MQKGRSIRSDRKKLKSTPLIPTLCSTSAGLFFRPKQQNHSDTFFCIDNECMRFNNTQNNNASNKKAASAVTTMRKKQSALGHTMGVFRKKPANHFFSDCQRVGGASIHIYRFMYI